MFSQASVVSQGGVGMPSPRSLGMWNGGGYVQGSGYVEGTQRVHSPAADI